MNTLVYFDTRWYIQLLPQDTLIVQLYSLDTPVLLFIQYAGCLYVAVSHVGAASGYTVYFGHTAFSHDGAAGSLSTLVLTAVSHDGAAGFWIHWYTLTHCIFTRWCCRFSEYVGSHCSFTQWCCRFLDTLGYFGHTAFTHDGASGSLNTLVLTVVLHNGAAGFWIHWYTLDTLQFHTMVLQVL